MDRRGGYAAFPGGPALPLPRSGPDAREVRHWVSGVCVGMSSKQFPLTSEFVEKWVCPFYMNVYHPSSHETELIHSTSLIWPELGDNIISDLLSTTEWRSRSCGAYFATLTSSTSNQNRIAELLLLSDRVYADRSYCLALAAMNTPLSVTTLAKYIGKMLVSPSAYAHTEDALGALQLLDDMNGTDHASAWSSLFNRPEGFRRDYAALMRIRSAVVA